MSRHHVRSSSYHRYARLSIQRTFRRPPASQAAPPEVELTNTPASQVAEATPARSGAAGNPQRLLVVIGLAAVVLFLTAVLRRGWVSDDAFITMRAVDHLIAGRGFVYNAGERVLGFTNPLWALLLSVPHLFVRDPYWTPVVGSIVVSAVFGFTLVFRSGGDIRSGALALVALCFSRSFIDFSTSGLENPLTHLLLLFFYVEYFNTKRQSLLRLSLFAALLLVNRFDSLPLWLPPLAFAYRQEWRESERKAVLLGWAPAILWFGFATIYYGFPLPNTAYAKLNAQIPRLEMMRQGLSYLVDAVVQDPMTILTIATALFMAYFASRPAFAARNTARLAAGVSDASLRDARLASAALAAMILELLYVVSIGGDFMSGRFLTPSVAVAAAVIIKLGEPFLLDSRQRNATALGLAALLACLAFSPLRDDPIREKRDFPVTRIVNERAWFQEHLALWVNIRPVQWKAYGLYGEGVKVRNEHRRVVLFNNVGMFAWGAGPHIHVVDDMALTDPLLARIPFEYREDWRTGHLPRAIPDGYLDTLESGRNVIRDPCIAEYFNLLDQVVRGPLFDGNRLAAIVTLNLPGGMTVKACPERVAPLPAPQPAADTGSTAP